MKRTGTVLSILIFSFITLSFASGQEKKNEEKVKVVVADKSGTKVVKDTVITWVGESDTIKIKSGNVIIISDESGDSHEKCKQIKVVAHVDKDGKGSDRQYVYINDGKETDHSGDHTFDIMLSDDEFDNDVDKTRYVISKNGITVSIEGEDEILIKELVKEIEKKLEINNNEPVPGVEVKKTEKKTVK
jgi:hypothetical protein